MTIPRLLVVDDDAETRGMMTEFLHRNGFMALPCDSETGIRSHLASGRVDLILLDVMLGDENGVEICARLRADQDVPIILVSALSADHQRMAGYEVGADDYIAKPFNPDLLLARVRAVLALGQAAQALHRLNVSGGIGPGDGLVDGLIYFLACALYGMIDGVGDLAVECRITRVDDLARCVDGILELRCSIDTSVVVHFERQP